MNEFKTTRRHSMGDNLGTESLNTQKQKKTNQR